MQDAWRAYLELALGLTEASRKKARQVASDLVGKGGATAAQAQSLVDDLISTSRTNREGLARLVRYEVDRALGAVGLASADEVAELTARLRDVERRLNESGLGGAERADAPPTVTEPAVATKPVAKKVTAKKATAKKATAQSGATTTAAKQPVAKKPVAKKTVASERGASRTRKATG